MTSQSPSAADLAQQMADLHTRKPRPLAKLYGAKGPTPDQFRQWTEDSKAWARAMGKLRREHARALEESNRAYHEARALGDI